MHESGSGAKRKQERAYQWTDEPTMTFFGFGIMPKRRQQDYWVCLNAYNWHAWALKEMGRRHWKEDKVLGFAWYSLVSKADPADAAQQNERRKNLTSTQLSEAKKQASDLRLRMTDSPCDALPGW